MGAGQGSNFYMQLKYRLKNTNILYFKKKTDLFDIKTILSYNLYIKSELDKDSL